MSRSYSRNLAFAVAVALGSLGGHFLARVEYFKVFPIVFVVLWPVFEFREPISMRRKLMQFGMVVIFGAVMFVIASFLWR